MIRLGVQGWELHRGPACNGCTPVPGLRDRFWARAWLQQFKSDQASLFAIRHLVLEFNTRWALPKATTDQTIDWMAKLLEDGEWHVHAPVLHDGGAAGGSDAAPLEEEDLAEIVSAPSAASARPAAPPPPVEEGALPRNADEEAIAQAMKLASVLGIPFCEECARAALKRAREAAHA